jgi:hypothetical protein
MNNKRKKILSTYKKEKKVFTIEKPLPWKSNFGNVPDPGNTDS